MIKIRKGEIKDLPRLFELIKELAVFEKELHQVSNTLEMMKQDGFGDSPIFGFNVAEVKEEIKGAAIYYFRYSTWKGKRIYLEDLIVSEDFRGKGAGTMLFDSIIKLGQDRKCTGMMWQVLDWNKPAIEFYKKYDTEFDEGWLNCHLQF